MAALADVLARLAREGELFERLPESRVRCYACGHRCLIPSGQRGVCKVRWNDDGRLMVPAGYVAGLQLDPVEKKPFFHAYPGARALSFGMLGCDYHCGYCIVGDTPVVTANGAATIKVIFDAAADPMPIPDGEARFPRDVHVITASGDVRRAFKAFRHSYRGDLAVVQPMYLPAVRCTPDHRWLATTDPSGDRAEEIRASDLTPDHFLLLPKPVWPAVRVIIDVAQLFADVTVTFAIPRTLSPTEVAGIGAATNRGESSRAIGARLGKDPSYIRHVRSKVHRGRWVYQKTQGLIVKDDTVRFPNEHRPGIPRHVQLDKPLARLLGFYCAEGSVTQSKTRPNSFKLAFAFGHGEQLARDEITESLTKLFGVRPQQVRRNTTTAITIGKASLALLFVALCGKGAGGKRVPAQIFTADASIQEAFLEAYLEGDGHVYPRGKSCATTVSRELAYGVALLLLRLGRLPSIYVATVGTEGRIQGRAVHRQPEQFSVVWYRERGPAQKWHDTGGHFCSYVSNGNATPEVLDYLRPWVDLYKVDLKGFDDKHYRKLGGVLGTVLETIQRLHRLGFWLEVVTLVVPGFNDTDAELRDIARFMASVSPDIPWHVTAFHPDYKMTDRDRTTAKTLLRAAEVGVGEGLHFVYAGNLPGRVGPFENTSCPSCRALLIERVGYTILLDLLTPTRGVCPSCGTRIPGRW